MASDRWRSAAFVSGKAEGESFPSVLLALQLKQFELDFPGVVSVDEEDLDSEGELQRQLAQFELEFPGVVAGNDFTVGA